MDQMMAQVQMLRNAKNPTSQSLYCWYFDSPYRHQLLSVVTVINRADGKSADAMKWLNHLWASSPSWKLQYHATASSLLQAVP